MFGSAKIRSTADEQHICVGCKRSNECDVETLHLHLDWRCVLTYCQRYEEAGE